MGEAANQPQQASLPLAGRRIVITRARHQAASLARAIEALGGEVIEFPTIEIREPASYAPLDRAISEIERYDWLIFTSANGVREFWQRFQRPGRSAGDLSAVRIAAIGPATADALRGLGLRADLVPGEYRAEAILREMDPQALRGKRVLLPRAAGSRDVLPKTLSEWGAEVDEVEAYRTVGVEGDSSWLRARILDGGVDAITFTSSSTVRHFVERFAGEDPAGLLSGVVVACIGPITRRTAQELGLKVSLVSGVYTVDGLARALADYFQQR